MIFSLAQTAHRKIVLNFLSQIEDQISAGSKVVIFFNKTEKLFPCGTLLFVAKIDQYLTEYPGLISAKHPANNVVEQLFQHIGLLNRLGLTSRVSVTAENVRYWHYIHGNTADVREFKNLLEKYALELEEPVRSGLYDGMSEAVTNAVQHAYPSASEGTSKKNWWAFSQQRNGELTVAILDLGIGIPASLRNRGDVKETLSMLLKKKRRDTLFIEMAAESKRTSTRLPHRGKGLPEMLEFVKTGHVGHFSIYSENGFFRYNGEQKTEHGRDFKNHPIKGTLIQWQVTLSI